MHFNKACQLVFVLFMSVTSDMVVCMQIECLVGRLIEIGLLVKRMSYGWSEGSVCVVK